LGDIGGVISRWGQTTAPGPAATNRGDLDASGKVGLADIGKVKAVWFQDCDPTAPQESASWYITSLDPNFFADKACDMAAVQNPFVILSFGAMYPDGKVILHDYPGTIVNLDMIGLLTLFYAAEFTRCVGSANNVATIIMGVTNEGNSSNGLDFSNGYAYGSQVKTTQQALVDDGLLQHSQVWGGMDIEPHWGAADGTISWLTGYDTVSAIPFVNFGSADGCYPYSESDQRGSSPPGNGHCDNYWLQQYVAIATRDVVNGIAMPDIYHRKGYNSYQWMYIARDSHPLGQPMFFPFLGTVSQLKSCQQQGCDPLLELDMAPAQSWNQFLDALQSETETYRDTLTASTNIGWQTY
jgi:hypothetical protein